MKRLCTTVVNPGAAHKKWISQGKNRASKRLDFPRPYHFLCLGMCYARANGHLTDFAVLAFRGFSATSHDS